MTDAETVQPRSVHEVRPIDLVDDVHQVLLDLVRSATSSLVLAQYGGEGPCTGEEGFCGVHGYHRHPVDGE